MKKWLWIMFAVILLGIKMNKKKQVIDSETRESSSQGTNTFFKEMEDRLNKSTYAIALFTGGLPFLVIGFTGLIDNILKSVPIAMSMDYLYYVLGMVMSCGGMRLYYKRGKEAYVIIIICSVILIVLVIIKLVLTTYFPTFSLF